MTLTAADLYTLVNSRTGRTGDHEAELKAILHDLAIRGVHLLGETTQALTSGTRNYTVPTNAKRVRLIALIDGSSVEQDPLDEITWHDYKRRLSPAASNGKPTAFVVQNGVIYLDPPPLSTSYPNMKITTELYHADSTTVSWPDRFRETLLRGMCYETYLGLDLGATLGAPHQVAYETGVLRLLAAQSAERNSRTRSNDI